MSDISYGCYSQPTLPSEYHARRELCYPRNGSKQYLSEAGYQAEIIAMRQGRPDGYIAQFYGSNGLLEEEKWVSYERAVSLVEAWMEDYQE